MGSEMCIRDSVYGLLGPNGAGKSTLMNLITDNLKLDKDGGEILWDGQPIRKLGKSYRACLGFMPQQQELYANMTARDFLGYLSALKGIPRKEAKDQIADVLEQVELSEQAAQKIGGFSGGMKQRVGIARAYTNSPEILLMDEPFGQLDAQTRYSMQEEVLRIWEKEKRTIIFVTNNIEEAVYLADRIVLLSNCPAKVKQVYDLGKLKRPRNFTDPEFLRIRKDISDNTDLAL